MVDEIIIGFIGFVVGLLCGVILMSWLTLKVFDQTWDEAYELGFKHGEEIEKIRQVNEHKEKLLFEPQEVNRND